jgi:hypothetical protein
MEPTPANASGLARHRRTLQTQYGAVFATCQEAIPPLHNARKLPLDRMPILDIMGAMNNLTLGVAITLLQDYRNPIGGSMRNQ